MRLATKIHKTMHHHARQAGTVARAWLWPLYRPSADRPVFVVGCSRSGTTLVYKLLSEARELGSLRKETHDFWMALHPLSERRWESHVIPASEASYSIRRKVERHFFVGTGKSRFVDKNNQAGFSIPYLRALFPDALFVYVKRNPGDTVNSMIEGWRRPDEFGLWSGDLPAEVRIDDGAIRRWCFFLPPGWRGYTDKALEEVCAFQYRAINEAIIAARDDVPADQWIEIGQEDIVADPAGAIRRLYAGCGLALDADTAARCEEVAGRPHNAFTGLTIQKWRGSANAARVARVVEGLRDVAECMGYDEPEWWSAAAVGEGVSEESRGRCAT